MNTNLQNNPSTKSINQINQRFRQMEIEKILSRLHSPNEIVLFKETLFCKAYEESAWQFCMLIRAYKPIKQYIKKVKKEMVSIGFPVSILENIKNLAKEKEYSLANHTPIETMQLVVELQKYCANK